MPYSVIYNKKGYSLLEMVTVIAIITVLAAVAVIAIKSNMPQYYLSGAARQVLTDLMLTRMQAVSTNAATTVTFNSTGYTIGGVAKDISSQFGGVSLSSTGNITFTTMGTASGSVTITLTGSPELPPKRVDVSAAGRVRIR
ncbi:MAG: GspH/FimT family pseudopilin [Desulfuromonadales bacterium]